MGSPAMKETTPTTSDPCAILRIPPTIRLPYEAPMPFSICPFHLFPVQCSVTYWAGVWSRDDRGTDPMHERATPTAYAIVCLLIAWD
jgi:hypothetical protein